LSPFGDVLTGAAQDLAAHCVVELPRGWHQTAELGAGAGAQGAGFVARPPPPSCRAEYASVTAGRTLGVRDQDLRWLEAWLGKYRSLAGVMARLLLPACCRRPIIAVVAGGSILLGHGVVPGGAWYANRLKGWMNIAPIIGLGKGAGDC
jgi:hypothetical protein